ncbi:MAG: DUF4032 domain-containing protein [Thermoflexia bacterium]|nr:MAG: DUF4032 domain-containing protein [Thermoflexia bacterium]
MADLGDIESALDFQEARFRAFLREVWSALSGRPNRLLSWQEVRDHLRLGGQVYRGIQTVPLEKIVGSVDRYRDFDRAFLPTQSHTAHRWRSISRAFYNDVSLPPVKLYKVGDAYFVLDGNHRVSVARDRGQEFIEAEVIEARTRVPVEANLNANDLEILGEYADFLERTHLDELRPDQNIRFTIGGGYARLLEHIAVHRYFMGLEQGRFIPEEEAITDWYDNVYLPLVRIIRDQDILKHFPDRTEADLYLWIIDHQHFLREQFGPRVQPEEAARHFADHYSSRLLHRMAHFLRELIRRPGPRKTAENAKDAEA